MEMAKNQKVFYSTRLKKLLPLLDFNLLTALKK